MPTEVELKLAARPSDLPELKRALVAMTPDAVSSQERVVSTYSTRRTGCCRKEE